MARQTPGGRYDKVGSAAAHARRLRLLALALALFWALVVAVLIWLM